VSETPLTRPSLLLRMRDLENERAWEEFAQIYRPLIYGYARKHRLQDADAADVAQETMRAVALAIRNFDYDPQKGRFRHWLFTAVRSKLNTFLAKQMKQPRGTGETAVYQFLEAQPAPEDTAYWDRQYDQRLFDWAAEQIKSEFKESTWQAFWQTAVEDRSGKEVAQNTGLSAGAVYVARSRVLARLKEKIAEIAS
jgi:RNA polymerase sigma-70 factor (ECF subfamily)